MTKKLRTTKQIDRMLDAVKDEIDDGLHRIATRKRRDEAARELIDYIELHYLSSSAEP